MSEPGVIKLEALINRSPKDVWQALTDPALIGKWWAPGDVKAVVGHCFELDMGGHFGKQKCEVLAVEKERHFSYTFAPGTLNTTITWSLVPAGDATLLRLEHAGFDLDSPMGTAAYDGMGMGWPQLLEKIESVIP